MKNVIRTPEDRFIDLPDYDFEGHYIFIEEGIRLHYLDEGKKDKPVILLLHGEPTWSYLYRKMIPLLVKNNFRVIAPDMVGFGKSDKPVKQEDYSYQSHIDWLKIFIMKLDLKGITLFCQNWGGFIGLRLITEMEERFDRVVASNTTLPIGKFTLPPSFMKWKSYAQHSPEFNVGKVINLGAVSTLSKEEIAAYNAPFPSEEFKAGARIFPLLVPTDSKDPESVKNIDTWAMLQHWNKPFLTLFGAYDDIMKGAEKAFQKFIPGAKGQPHQMLKAGHFIQEDQPEELVKAITAFYRSTKANS